MSGCSSDVKASVVCKLCKFRASEQTSSLGGLSNQMCTSDVSMRAAQARACKACQCVHRQEQAILPMHKPAVLWRVV